MAEPKQSLFASGHLPRRQVTAFHGSAGYLVYACVYQPLIHETQKLLSSYERSLCSATEMFD